MFFLSDKEMHFTGKEIKFRYQPHNFELFQHIKISHNLNESWSSYLIKKYLYFWNTLYISNDIKFFKTTYIYIYIYKRYLIHILSLSLSLSQRKKGKEREKVRMRQKSKATTKKQETKLKKRKREGGGGCYATLIGVGALAEVKVCGNGCVKKEKKCL